MFGNNPAFQGLLRSIVHPSFGNRPIIASISGAEKDKIVLGDDHMMRLKKLIGLPVVLNGRNAGHVLKAVVTRDGHNLRGLILRGGVRGPRWLSREQIQLLGKVSIIASGETRKVPRDAEYKLFRVSDSDGTRLGVVSDAVIHEETLQVIALEISSGPVDDLIDGRWLATAFTVQPGAQGSSGHVTIPEEVN